MHRSARLLAFVMIVTAAVGGCVGDTPPHIPTVLDPQGPLVETAHADLPVPPGADGTWHLLVPYHGIIGEGRRVVRVGPNGEVRWSVDLPERYALTSSDGGPHSASLIAGGTLVLLAGEPGRHEPTAMMALDVDDGHRRWELELPPVGPDGSVRLVNGSQDEDRGDPNIVVIARCEASACDLWALDELDGRRRWSRHVPGAKLVAGGFVPVFGGRGQWPESPYQPWIWTAGPGFLRAVSKVDGTLGGRTPLPADEVGIVVTEYDRVVVASAPREATCRATMTGYDVNDDGAAVRVWSLPFRWDDPRIAPGRHGCRYDPGRPWRSGSLVMVPDVNGALAIRAHDGVVDHRYRRGDRPLPAYGLVWERDHYVDRAFAGIDAIGVPPPRAGGPWAVELYAGAWVLGSGDGGTLVSAREPEPLWHQAGALSAIALEIDRLAFLTADQIIVIGPERTATRLR